MPSRTPKLSDLQSIDEENECISVVIGPKRAENVLVKGRRAYKRSKKK